MCPASATPCRPSPKTAHAPVLSSTAASGPGSRGHPARAANKNVSTAAAINVSPALPRATPCANELTWLMKLSPLTGTPVSRPSCPLTMISATPAR